MNEGRLTEALSEAVGTYGFVFFGAAVLCTDAYSAGSIGLVGVALAHGLILAALVTGLGHVSGAHFNPAVTFAAVLTGDMRVGHASLYVVAQLVGAVAAGLTLLVIFGTDIWDPVMLGAPLLGDGVSVGTAILVEGILTFFLVVVVMLCLFDRRAPEAVYGLAIGATVAAGVLVAGPITGAALNPARALGPALAASHWTAQYVYWLGPLAGAAFAALAYMAFRDRSQTVEEVRLARLLEERDDAIDEAERLAGADLRVVEDD